MNKTAMGLLILLAVSLLTALSQWYTYSSIKSRQTSLDEMLQYIEEERYDVCLEKLEQTQKEFNRQQSIMATYTSHLRLEEIDASFSRLHAYLEKESANDSAAEVYALKKRFAILLHEEKIDVENIL